MSGENTNVRQLPTRSWQTVLAEVLLETLEKKERALLCLTGKAGSGKTTLARMLRKEGLPGLPPSQVSVIDDGVMTAPLFGFINRRVRLPCDSRDDLSVFEPYLRGKRLVVYVAIRPEERISRCDVLLRLRCDDEERRERLVGSRQDGAIRYERSLAKTDSVALEADYYFDLRSDSAEFSK